MSLFGNHRDDRRRRVLAEELSSDTPATADAALKPGGKTEKSERYATAARRENHGRTTDLVPRSVWPLALLYAVGLALVAGLLFGFVSHEAAAVAGGNGMADILDAAQGGSLAGWFSSLMFILSSVVCVLIYSVRRHKLDDYRGRYRLWLWCAAAWIAMSIDATANLHAPFSRAMARATGWSMLPEGAAWWIGVWGMVLSILSLRLLLEMRECRLAVVSMAGVDLLWLAALATDFDWMPAAVVSGAHATAVAIGCRLAAQVTLLMTTALYAKHVLLDAEGQLKLRPPKAKREKPAKKSRDAKPVASENSAQDNLRTASTRIDTGHKAAASSSNYGSPGSTTHSSSQSSNRYGGYEAEDDDDDDRLSNRRSNHRRFEDDSEDDDADDDDNHKLSKAERKRLRKQMRRQQREDER